jgi:transposase
VAFRDKRVKASEEAIARSLEGNWQDDLLFMLKQEQDGYEFCQKQMSECDVGLQQYLQRRDDRSKGAELPEENRKERLRKKKTNKPRFDLRTELFRMTGIITFSISHRISYLAYTQRLHYSPPGVPN